MKSLLDRARAAVSSTQDDPAASAARSARLKAAADLREIEDEVRAEQERLDVVRRKECDLRAQIAETLRKRQ